MEKEIMKNLKNAVLLLSALALAAFLAGCAGAAPQTPTEPVPSTQTPPPPTTTPPPTETLVPTVEAAPPPTESASTAISYASDVYPILEAKCVKCHGVERVKEGLNMLTYEQLMAGSFNGPVIVPGNADESLLAQLIAEGEMPDRGPKVTEAELQVIKNWINAGALNN